MADILAFPSMDGERLRWIAWEDYLYAKTQYEIVRDNYYAGNWLMQKVFVKAEDYYAEATRKLMAVI